MALGDSVRLGGRAGQQDERVALVLGGLVLVSDPVAPIMYERVVAAGVGMASESVLTAYYSCQTGASAVVPPHLCIVTTQSFHRASA